MKYELQDTWGMPQCGCEVLTFDEFWELLEYIEETPGLEDRLSEGYALIIERS